MIDPKSFYTEKITSYSGQIATLQNKLVLSSILRLVVFIALIFGVYSFFGNTKGVAIVVVLGLALFLFLIARHQDIKYKRDLLLQLIGINEKEVKILQRDFHDFETCPLYTSPSPRDS